MRQEVIEAVKAEIETILKDYLREEGLELLTAPKAPSNESPMVMFEGIENMALDGRLLQWEIRVILGILGKAGECDDLADGIYRALVAYRPTATELTVLLTSLHVNIMRFARSVSSRATIRCILGEEQSEP